MRSENTFGVTFSIRQNKNKRKDYSVFARIACNNTPEREITIKGGFKMEDWDEDRHWPLQTTQELRELSTYLEKVKAKLTTIFQELEFKEGVLSAAPNVLEKVFSSVILPKLLELVNHNAPKSLHSIIQLGKDLNSERTITSKGSPSFPIVPGKNPKS